MKELRIHKDVKETLRMALYYWKKKYAGEESPSKGGIMITPFNE